MGRKAKSVVKQKKASSKKTANSFIRKIKDYERCKEWLHDQKIIPHDTIPVHDINDEESSEYDNGLYRKIESEEKQPTRVG